MSNANTLLEKKNSTRREVDAFFLAYEKVIRIYQIKNRQISTQGMRMY